MGSCDPERCFDKDDVAVLETFAGLASPSARVELRAELAARIQRFYGIASVLAWQADLARRDARRGREGGERGPRRILRRAADAGADNLVLAAGHELPELLAAELRAGLPESAGALVPCARERRTLAASDVLEDDRFEPAWHGLAARSNTARSSAIQIEAPRREQGGLVLVFFAEQRNFTDDGSARAAAPRRRGSWRPRAQRALRDGAQLACALPAARADGRLLATSSIRGDSRRGGRAGPALLGADAASVRRLEEDVLVVSAASGEGAEAAMGSEAATTAWLVGEIVQSRGPKAVADVAGDRRLLDADPIFEGYSSYLGVPLFGAEGELYGVLAVYGSIRGRGCRRRSRR